MVRVSWVGFVVLLGTSACGETERDASRPLATGGGGSGGSSNGGGASNGGSSSDGGANELAGGAGDGGMFSEVPGVADCQRHCEGTPFRLPGALCEDWNRPGWNPEFCGLPREMSCAAYCRNVYETVSPGCAATLPAVVRCVAPTYLSVDVPSLGSCWLGDCRDLLFDMTSVCYGLREQLAAGRAAWQASGVVDYELQYDWDSDGVKARVTVRAGSEPVVEPAEAQAWTVPQLFDRVEAYLDTPHVAPDAKYDPALGYVSQLQRLQGCDEPADSVYGIEVTPLP